MGNRAVITTEEKKIGIYLHWNGGYDSVNGYVDTLIDKRIHKRVVHCPTGEIHPNGVL